MLDQGIFEALKQIMRLGQEITNQVRMSIIGDIQSKYDQYEFQKPADEDDDSNLQNYR